MEVKAALVELRLPTLAVERAAALSAAGRRILGIAGAPGAGKSSFAAALAAALPGRAIVVGMDAFHLADAELRRQGSHARKGAPDTFDVGGYLALLRRLGVAQEAVVYAPVFHRGLEAAIGGALAVPRGIPLVITEGNYLLCQDDGWRHVRPLLDECWFLEVDEHVRRTRLQARHEEFGRSPERAREWTLGPDEENARIVASSRGRADAVVRLSPQCEPDDASTARLSHP